LALLYPNVVVLSVGRSLFAVAGHEKTISPIDKRRQRTIRQRRQTMAITKGNAAAQYFRNRLATQSIRLTGLKSVGNSLAYLIDLTLDALFLLGLE
jgi:hypothetical protein